MKTLKHSLFKCELPKRFEKKWPDALGCCAFSAFHFPPFPELFRTEFWFTLGKKEDFRQHGLLVCFTINKNGKWENIHTEIFG